MLSEWIIEDLMREPASGARSGRDNGETYTKTYRVGPLDICLIDDILLPSNTFATTIIIMCVAVTAAI